MKHPLVKPSALQRLIENGRSSRGGGGEQGRRGGEGGEQLYFSSAEYEIPATDEFTCKPAPHQGKDTVSGVK